jgi:chromosome partitioning protein
MRTIAIINQKGGCGKTTVSINLASALAERGNKTLLVDMDPQSHCAVGLAVPEEQIEQSIYDVLVSHSRGEPLRITEVMWKISDGFELAPASIDLAAFEQQMTGDADKENCLKTVLDQVSREYDTVVIDCPPSVGLLTFNAIRAATDIVVPVETGYFSLHGLSKQLSTLSVLCDQRSQEVNVMVLASMYDIRTKMGREILGELRKHFSAKMFKSVVNFNTKLKEAASFGQPISEYDPASRGHKDFQSLADELVSTDTKAHRTELVNALQTKLDAISASADELLSTMKTPPASKPVVEEAVKPAEKITITETKPVVGTKPPIQAKATIESKPIAEMKPAVEIKQIAQKKTIDEKIADFYGVRQVDDAIMFVSLYPKAQSVQLAGDFNDWDPANTSLSKNMSKGTWHIKLPLGVGKYRYRLVVDGKWQQDPYNERTEMNPYGECNSVLEVS